MRQWLGLILVTLGIGLTAGAGAVLAPGARVATLKRGEAHFADQEVTDARNTYCDTRAQFKAQPADGCEGDLPLVDSTAGLSPAEVRQAELSALEGRPTEVLVLPVSQARIRYRLALRKSARRHLELEALGAMGPLERLAGWWGTTAPVFVGGLILLGLGGWISRRSNAARSPQGGQGPGAEDFLALLQRVEREVEALSERMASTGHPDATALAACKARLETIQRGDLERLCASGPQVAAQLGVEGMAQIFSPLSGAERRLNRAWSAMVDRHWPEAMTSVKVASGLMGEAVAAAESL